MRNLVILLASLISTSAYCQSFDISGKVSESEISQSITNAYIFLENTEYGTTSDGKGYFLLEDVPSGKYTMVVSGEGYTTCKKQFELINNLEVNIELSENILDLPQLVVESQTLSLGRMGMKEIPGSVQYISPKELRNYNYTNINDVMKMVPGVNIQEEEGFGLRPNIGLRGSGLERSSRISIMEDGILAAPAPYASPSAYYFPTTGRMNSVEILKGASQIRFGPFTTGGAINFISTPIPSQLSTRFQLSSGSFGYKNLHAFVGDSYDRIGFLVETFQYSSDGFKDLPNEENTGFDKKDYQVKFRINSQPAKSLYQSLNFTAGRTDELSHETYLGLTAADFKNDPYERYAASQVDNMDAAHERFNVQHYLEIPGWFNVVTTVYRNEFKRNWYKLQSIVNGRTGLSGVLSNPTLYDWEYSLLTGNFDTDTTSLKVRANNRKYVSEGIQSVFDIEFETGSISHDIHLSGRFHRDEEDRFQWEDGYGIENGFMKLVEKGTPGTQANRIESARAFAGYVFYKLDIGRVSLTPGLRYENVTIQREDFGKNDVERSGSDFSTRENSIDAWLPGLGINYQLNNGLAAFGGIHRGFAPPGSKPDTKPESSLNYELGIRKINSRIEGTAVLFINDYQNLLGRDIAAAGGTGSGDVFNAGSALTKGLEFAVGSDLLGDNDPGIAIPLQISYTYTDASFTTDFEAEFDEWGSIAKGDKLPYVANHQLFGSIGVRHQSFSVFLNSKYQSDVRIVPGQGRIDPEESVEGFATFDFSSNLYLNKYMSFNLSINNLLDNRYSAAARPAGLRPGMPRSFIVGIKVFL